MNDHAQKKNEDKKEKPMMPSPPPPISERRLSIDAEPKTLSQEELKLAWLKMKDHAQKKIEDKKEKLMMSSSPPKLERKQSIDAEPKTLLQEELKLAREEALKVLKTHPKEEALKIFLAGLNPVTSSRHAKDDVVLSDCDEE